MFKALLFTLSLFALAKSAMALETLELTGKWKLNEEQSDNVEDVFYESVKVKKRTLGSGKKNPDDRLLFSSGKRKRDQVFKLSQRIPMDVLKAGFVVVRQHSESIEFDYLHTNRLIRTDGRSNPVILSQISDGGRDVATGVWGDLGFEVEIVSALGAHVEEVWRQLPNKIHSKNPQLEVSYTVTMPLYLQQPVQFKRIYDWLGEPE